MLREKTMEKVTDIRNRLTAAQIAIAQDHKDGHEMNQAMMGGYERCLVMYEKILERNEKMIADLNKLLAQKEKKEVIIANLSAEKIETEALIAAKKEEIATLRGSLAEQKNRFSVLFASVGSGIAAILLMNLFPKKKK